MEIRNFSIISHIDHGKSTLADRFLELTGAVSREKLKPQFLDMMDLEREKGITIKLQPARMEYGKYVLNLVDTPGHVDFSYEVSRSLAAVEGALLLVDASKGIQAQTLANLELARKQKLVIIPIVNKIDLPYAETEKRVKELTQLLNAKEKEVLKISAKNGTNCEQVLKAVIEKIPPPSRNLEKPFRALVFDSKYDPFKGIIAYVRVVDGKINQGEKIKFFATRAEGVVKELGFFLPELSPQKELSSGEIGYIATGIKNSEQVRVGDTIIKINEEKRDSGGKIEPLPGYKEPQPMVFSSFYPENPDDFDILKTALTQLKLNDPALTFELEFKEGLGRGFRCGFLGTLHAEIIAERISREFGISLVISLPTVVYKIIDQKGKEKLIFSPSDWPNPVEIKKTLEPWVFLEIITPLSFLGRVLEVLKNKGGKYIETKYLGQERVILYYELPLREIIMGFYDELKSVSRGFASMGYKILGYREADLVKMEILIAGEKKEAFSKIVPREKAFQEGKSLVGKLKKFLPRQQFAVALQAVVGGKIIARETIRAARKDVIAPLYGGDYSRKKKLLEKQKKGKKKLKERGRVNIPPETFFKVWSSKKE